MINVLINQHSCQFTFMSVLDGAHEYCIYNNDQDDNSYNDDDDIDSDSDIQIFIAGHDFATRYSTRYSDLLSQPYSNPTLSKKNLLAGP